LGGGLTVDELVELALLIDPSLEADTAAVRSGFELFADLDPSPADESVCRALSLGARLSAVPITVAD